MVDRGGIARLPGTCQEWLDYLLVLGVHARDASVLPDRRENLEELVVGNAREAVGVGAEQRELEPDGAGLDERADVGATGSGAYRAQAGRRRQSPQPWTLSRLAASISGLTTGAATS